MSTDASSLWSHLWHASSSSRIDDDAFTQFVNSEPAMTSSSSTTTAWTSLHRNDADRIKLDYNGVTTNVYTDRGDLSVTVPTHNLYSFTADVFGSFDVGTISLADRLRPNYTVGHIKHDIYYEFDNVTSFGMKRGIDDVTVLMMFCEWYQAIHGYMAIAVCSFGIVANIMNIVVLTQKVMVSPTNWILTALAITDLLTMSSYLPYAVYYHCISAPEPDYKHGWGWIVFLIFHNNFIITLHTAAMWLTVLLAIFRYIVICHHALGPQLCNLRRTKLAITAVFFTTTVCCSPNYFLYRPVPYRPAINSDNTHDRQKPTTVNSTCDTQLADAVDGYWFAENEYVTQTHRMFTFWLYGVVLKVVPCALLTGLSTLLVRAMKMRAYRRRSSLGLNARRRSSTSAAADRDSDRTTTMLVVVVLTFVATELPQGILAFLSGVDSVIFEQVYVPLGDFWDFLVLINSSANFILYCAMSAQFRTTFVRVFVARYCNENAQEVRGAPGGEYRRKSRATTITVTSSFACATPTSP